MKFLVRDVIHMTVLSSEKVMTIYIPTGTGVFHFKNEQFRTSLVAQWLRIRLPMQGTWVRALVWEDPTCHGATKLVHHNY